MNSTRPQQEPCDLVPGKVRFHAQDESEPESHQHRNQRHDELLAVRLNGVEVEVQDQEEGAR